MLCIFKVYQTTYEQKYERRKNYKTISTIKFEIFNHIYSYIFIYNLTNITNWKTNKIYNIYLEIKDEHSQSFNMTTRCLVWLDNERRTMPHKI